MNASAAANAADLQHLSQSLSSANSLTDVLLRLLPFIRKPGTLAGALASSCIAELPRKPDTADIQPDNADHTEP